MQNTGEGTSFRLPSTLQDCNEQRRKRDRERYAQMTNEQKQEKLKRRREVYQQKKAERDAAMPPEHKKSRIKQATAKKSLRHSTPSKDSVAMENTEGSVH
jgi:hypothetical protein